MNKQFTSFLNNKEQNERKSNANGCFHGDDGWCTNCVNFGQLVGDSFGGQGRIVSNCPELTEAVISKLNLKKL